MKALGKILRVESDTIPGISQWQHQNVEIIVLPVAGGDNKTGRRPYGLAKGCVRLLMISANRYLTTYKSTLAER